MASSLNQSQDDRLNDDIKTYESRIDEIYTELAIESDGVAQAVAALRRALDKVDECFKRQQYEDVANLGYRNVSSKYIFLQRTIGSLLTAAHRRSSLISDIAKDAELAYERVQPMVKKLSRSSKSEAGSTESRS